MVKLARHGAEPEPWQTVYNIGEERRGGRAKPRVEKK